VGRRGADASDETAGHDPGRGEHRKAPLRGGESSGERVVGHER
jgi:hypothetical protein